MRDTAGRVLCGRCRIAENPFTRMRGLLGRDSLPPGEGLLLRPAGQIHTAFMRFAIDVVFLDRSGVVLAVRSDLAPWRMAGVRGARAVLELPAGEARWRGLEPGDQLDVVSTEVLASHAAARPLPPRPQNEAEPAGFAASQGR
jgi:hypothetical protein